ncbi:MAG: DNA mismatch repair endonuclease MutL [Polyangiaceae bacterium]
MEARPQQPQLPQLGKVRRLPADLANQIAAGEVVERPASVVKELVENALDAGATRVRVEIDHGGTTCIRVVDDGEGMIEEDARLALERHATSKIARIEDLLGIGTFGFRGEALPSIGSVARLTLATRVRKNDEGVELVVEGGGEARVRPCGCAPGTSVEVRELFFNVPARRKFLKSTATESAHVGEAVLLAALARPDVTFVLARDGRVAREYLRVQTRGERAKQAIVDEALEACVASRGPLHIEAHLAAPERARAGAVGLYLFVNGRPVKDRQLARAVAQAYGSVLEPGRYPVGVLYIDLPPEHVDVNVHPQKAEIRFADARGVFDAVSRELNLALGKAFAIPALGPMPYARAFQAWSSNANGNPSTNMPWRSPALDAASSASASGPDPWSLAPAQPGATDATGDASSLFSTRGFYARLRFVGQVRTTFLLCEGDDGLYVLDQHAAAERVTFDRLRLAYAARSVPSQRLLAGEIVELLPAEVAALEENADAVAALGLELRAVGASAVAVHAVPGLVARAAPARLVRDVVAEVSRAAGRPFGGAADLVLATMACHGSTRAGDTLSREEAEALLRALDTVDFSGHCPHGRPVVTRISFDELERRVGR